MRASYYRTNERQERSRAKELARQLKERDKQSALDQARLQVEQYDARIQELKSTHRQCSDPIDWLRLASQLPPLPPRLVNSAARAAERARFLLGPLGGGAPAMEAAVLDDEKTMTALEAAYVQADGEHGRTAQLALRILAKDPVAYVEVLRDSPAIAELTEGGGRIEFTAASSDAVECMFYPQSNSVVPAEVLTLTPTGKLTSKAMPRAQFTELYQDFVCSGILRIAREVFALVPAKAVLVTTFLTEEGAAPVPIISAILDRARVAGLPFDTLDPSDTVEVFPCRTKFKASRRDSAFLPIDPLTREDVNLAVGGGEIFTLFEAAKSMLRDLDQVR